MESNNSRKLKYKWGSLADMSPSKCLKYSDVPQPCGSLGNFEDGQKSAYRSGRISLSKSLEENQSANDYPQAFAEGTSGMETEYVAFPGDTAHSSGGAEDCGFLRRGDPSFQKTLFNKCHSHEQSSETVWLPSKSSVSELKHTSESASDADCSLLSRDTSKETSQEECSSGERKRRMTGQASPALFMKALDDVLRRPIDNRVRRATPTSSKESIGTPCQSTDLSGYRDVSYGSFDSFTSGDWEEQETEQGANAKHLPRNAQSCAASGYSHQNRTEAYPSFWDSHHIRKDTNFESGVRCHSSNAVYSKSRESLPSDTTVNVSPRVSRHSDPVVYPRERGTIYTALYPKSRDRPSDTAVPKSRDKPSNTANYQKPPDRPSDTVDYPKARDRPSDTVDYPKARDRPSDTVDYPKARDRPSDTGDYPKARDRPSDTGDYPKARDRPSDTVDYTKSWDRPSNTAAYPKSWDRPSDTVAYPKSGDSRHSNTYESSRGNRHSDPAVYTQRENMCGNNVVYPKSWDRGPCKAAVHPSGERRHSDSTSYPLRESKLSNAIVYLKSRDSRLSDAAVHPLTKDGNQAVNPPRENCHSDSAVYPRLRESRPSDPGVNLLNESRHNDSSVDCTSRDSIPCNTAVCSTSWDNSRNDHAVHPSLKDTRHSDPAVYPTPRDRQHMSFDVSGAPEETRHVTMETRIAPGDGQSTSIIQQEPVDVHRVDICEEAPRLVFLPEHDSDEDGTERGVQEPDVSFGSDFSDIDDVIPLAKLSQEEPVQAKSLRQEDIQPVVYPPPLFLSSWSSSSRYWTSSPVYPSTTGQSSLYLGASSKACVSANSTFTTSSSNSTKDSRSLTEGWCCRSSSYSDSWISVDKSGSFNEEPDLHISVNQEAHTPGVSVNKIERRETHAELPKWMYEGFIDTHCHLDMLYDKLSFAGTFAKFRQVYSSTFPKEFHGCIADFCNPRLTKKFPWEDMLREDMVWGAFGCHPHFARFYNDFQERELLQAMRHPKAIAFGEMGLDYSHKCSTDVLKQKKVFERQLQLAVGLRKPLVIHCRDADEDLLEIMKKAVPRDYKIHRHCFTGRFSVIEPFLEAFPNMAVGFTALLTYPTAIEARDTVRKIPLEKIIVETDAPYFLPKQVHKSVCSHSHPGLAIHTVKEIARIKDLPPSSVLAVIRQNTNQLYNL